MKLYIKSIAILIAGISFFHLFSTIQVYLSNSDLLAAMNSLSKTGYLLMPNRLIMERLDDLSTAFAGGVFFTLSIGTFTVLISFLASVLYVSFDTIKKYVLVVAAVFFSGIVFAINANGLCIIETLSFLLVPSGVFYLYKRAFAHNPDKPAPVTLAAHFVPVIILAVFLVLTTIHSSNKIFIDFRDTILMSNKAGMTINKFYYDYTLYPARVFKPYLQRKPKLCAIDSEHRSADVKVIEKRLLQNDFLVVDKSEQPDFILRKDKKTLSFLHNGRKIVETPVSKFISRPSALLKEFSDKTDKYGVYRQITGTSLKTGFPLYMYILMHFSFFLVFYTVLSGVGQQKKASSAASLSCLIVGLLGFWFLFSSENYEVSKENLSQVLQSDVLKERVAGLRFVATEKLDISDYAEYDTSFPENTVPEKYWFARSLAGSRTQASYDRLIKLLDDPNQNVVCQALYSLGAKRKKEAIPVIIDHIKTSENWYAQWYGYQALKRLRWTQRKLN